MGLSFNSMDPNDSSGYRPLAEMNVTPLVDVMLVLLIIFMVAAPLLISGVTLDLPRQSAAPLPEVKDRIVLSITPDRKLYIGDEAVAREALDAHLRQLQSETGATTIFVRGDAKADYGTIMEVLSDLGKAGFHDISLLTEEPSGTP